MNRRTTVLPALAFFAASFCAAQSQPASGMSGHDMSNMNMSGNSSTATSTDDGAMHAMHSMEGHHMDMGPHMKMTAMREIKPGDQERADAVVQAARSVAQKYSDYKVALADGFQIFMPNHPQKNITSPTIATHSKPGCISIPTIRPRCSTKNTVTTTN